LTSVEGEENLARREDLTGQVFGRLTVIEYEGPDRTKKHTVWKCKCECGKEISVIKQNLKRGNTKSCGCLKKDLIWREDLTGQVFGKLTAIEYIGLDETKKHAMWKCKCECGKEIITRKISLKSGGSRSCGCTNKVNKFREDLTGQVFERLTVIEYAGYEPKGKSTVWKCKCECGKEIISQKHALINGRTKSCGCLTRYSPGDNVTHGLSGQPVYHVWESMRDRCNNPNSTGYENYGGRGIKVCDEWNNSFEAFYRDMGDAYKKGLSIERIDVNGNYNLENCKWATNLEQQNNKRTNRFITVFGERLSIAQVSRKYNINQTTLRYRLKRGLSPEDAVTIPINDLGQEKRK